MFKEGFNFEFTAIPVLSFIAKKLAEEREELNKKLSYYKDPYYYREELSSDIEHLGILGELIARHYLEVNNIPFIGNKIINRIPAKKPDIIINDINYDVKTIKEGNDEFQVNEKAHTKEKNIDWYWFVKILGHDDYNIFTKHYFYLHESISNWELKQLRFTPAYCKDIN